MSNNSVAFSCECLITVLPVWVPNSSVAFSYIECVQSDNDGYQVGRSAEFVYTYSTSR